MEPTPDPSDPPKRLTRRRLVSAVAVVLVAFGVWYFAVRASEPRDDFGRFQGEWQLAKPAVGRDNQPAARVVPGVRIRVTGDCWAYVVADKETARYTMGLRADAKEIDLVMLGPDGAPTGYAIRGVYTIGDGRAKVAYAPKDEPRPTTTDENDPKFSGGLWLLERVP